MEQPLIVLLDAENRCVHIYGAHTRTIPFEDVFLLHVFLEGKDAYYVESLTPVSGDSINEMVDQMRDPNIELEKRYVRCKVEGYTRIPELKMTFAGPKDCKPLDVYGYELFLKSPTLKRYLLEDKVEILTESEVAAIKKRPDPKAKDKGLDSILLQKPVDKALSESSMYDDPNLDEIGEETQVMTEAQEILKKHKEFGKREQ